MGRALYSLAYAAPQPAVRTEAEAEVDKIGRWNAWNRFDPDSDDFFQDAEYEAFIDSREDIPILVSPVSPPQNNPPFIPPPFFRQPSPDPEPFRRTVNIVPINLSRIQIQPATRSPSPDSPATTPPPQLSRRRRRPMLTPSPPPSVTPRFYSWQTHSTPTSPTANNRRPLQSSPARVRVPNTVM